MRRLFTTFIVLMVLPVFGALGASDAEEYAPLTNPAYLSLEQLDFSKLRVADLIARYRQAGIDITYSKVLISRRKRVSSNPPVSEPMSRLRAVLRSERLQLQFNASASRWFVVIDPDPKADEELDARNAKSVSPLIEEVLVTTSRYQIRQEEDSSRRTLDAQSVSSRPLLGADPVRILSTLPGVSSLGLSADANIRGGVREELLVRFNDVELVEPYHLKDFESVFSALNPSVIASVDVYTGGFPARYGNRMSGVFDVTTNSDFQGTGFEADVSVFNASLLGYGQLGQNSSWNASARRGNLDLIAKAINPDVGEPKYSDFHMQMFREVSREKTLDVGVFGSLDDISLESLDEGAGDSARSEYNSYYAWAHLRNLRPGYSRRTSAVVTRIDNSRDGFGNETDLDESNGSVSDDREFTMIRAEQLVNAGAADGAFSEYGWSIAYQRGKYDYRSQVAVGGLAGLLGSSLVIDRDLSVDPQGVVANVHYAKNWQLNSRFAVLAGARVDAQSYIGGRAEVQFSPRVSIGFDLTDTQSLRLSGGRFHQPEAIHELQIADGRTEFQHRQFTDQAALSYEIAFGGGLKTRAEAYYKRTRSPHIRYENLANPLVLLPEISPDRFELSPDKARALGVELSVSYQPSASFQTWINYSRSAAEDQVAGRWISRRWDEQQRVAMGVVYTASNWTASLLAAWHPGWRTTRLPDRVDSLSVPLELDLYGEDLGAYFSLDAKVAYTWDWPRNSLKVYADVTNLTNRANVGALEIEVEPVVDGFTLERSEETLFPLVPSIGFTWYFN